MSTQGSGPTIRTLNQGPVHINDVNINADYSHDDEEILATDNNDVQFINLHVTNNSNINNNNSTTNINLHTQRRRRHPHQTTLFQYLLQSFRTRYGNENDDITNDLWGHSFATKSQNTIRIWYTNPRGLGPNPNNHKSHNAMMFLSRKSQADIVCLAETNLRWPSLQYNSRLNHRLKSVYQEYYSVASYNKHENLGKCQRGGTCSFAVNQITHRVRRSGVDSSGMGRWSWIQLEGRNGHITRVMTAYRPCRAPTTSGLTTNWDQQYRHLRNTNNNNSPIQQFDNDIIQELRGWLELNMLIVLCIDINDHAVTSTFSNSIFELGLINVHHHYGNSPLPSTHDTGSRPISAIFTSPTLIPTRLGILPHGVGVEGDHRNMYADFRETTFLGDEMYIIPPPIQRWLKLFDSRIVSKFNKLCHSHLQANNIQQQLETLTASASFPPQQDVINKMEAIDDQIRRAIRHADNHCRKLRTGEIPFSTEYVEVNRPRRFWLLLLWKRYGRRVSNTTIRRLAKQIDIQSYQHIDNEEAKKQLKQARARSTAFIEHAKTSRVEHNEALAVANAASMKTTKEKALKRILHEEAQKSDNRQMSAVYKRVKLQRLDSVTVFRNGEWVEVTNPSEVADELQKMNSEKYSSTNNTPLMEARYVDRIGYLAEKPAAQQLLNGTYLFPENTPPHELSMLQYLQSPPNVSPLPITITAEDYKRAWNRVKENKSSSMSGQHFGVYKSITRDDTLLQIFTAAFNLPFITGVPYQRWAGFLNVMTEKEEGNRRVDKLRSLILGEADWNMGGRIHINRNMLRNANGCNAIPDEHYGGRRGYKATDAILDKRLALDNIRLFKRPAAITSTDAANCYDRMVHSYISLSAQRLGVPLSIILALLRPLQESRHYIRTAIGDSTSYYGGRQETPFQGSGQGNASSSPFWLIVSSAMIEMMKNENICATFTTSITLVTFLLVMVMYVDDNDIFVTSTHTDQLPDVIRRSQQSLNTWRKTLQVTGGVVRPKNVAGSLLHLTGVEENIFIKPLPKHQLN